MRVPGELHGFSERSGRSHRNKGWPKTLIRVANGMMPETEYD